MRKHTGQETEIISLFLWAFFRRFFIFTQSETSGVMGNAPSIPPRLFGHFTDRLSLHYSCVTEQFSNTYSLDISRRIFKIMEPSRAYFPACLGISWAFPVHFSRSNMFAFIKGTVQRDFFTSAFSQMDSSQASYLVFKDFSNLAFNSMRQQQFLIDSPLLSIAESLYSPYRLLRRVATLRIILVLFTTESHYSPPHILWGVTVDSRDLFSKH